MKRVASLSALIVVPVAILSSLLPSRPLLDYADIPSGFFLFALASIALAGWFARRGRKDARSPSRSSEPSESSIASLRDRFPAAHASHSGPVALTPSEWYRTHVVDRREGPAPIDPAGIEAEIAAALVDQVQRETSTDMRIALGVAFRCFERGGKNARHCIEDLTRRMNALLPGDRLDLKSYLDACRRIGDYEWREVHALFPAVDLAMKYRAATQSSNLPTSEFLWLKKIDRTLWYALNNVGRKAFHIEGIGAMAHMEAQLKAGKDDLLRSPAVDGAVTGIRTYFDGMGIDPAGIGSSFVRSTNAKIHIRMEEPVEELPLQDTAATK